MNKRKRSWNSLGTDPCSSPDGWASVYEPKRMTKVTRTSKEQPDISTPPRIRSMSALLEFIIAHEEAFQKRIDSLYADFSQHRDINPDGYRANISAWKKALTDAARAGAIRTQGNTHGLLSIRTGDELAKALQRNGGRPPCLPVVIADAVEKKEMIPEKDFLNSSTSIYKTSWVPSPWSMLNWGLKKAGIIGQPGTNTKLQAGNFVILENVEAAASEILKEMSTQASSVDMLLSRPEFLKRFAHVLGSDAPLTSNDMNILLVHLARDKKAISYNAQTIKFKPESEPNPLPITQEDTAIVHLRDTLARIHAQITPLEEKVRAADATAREAVKNKQMARAKAALRQKKMTESALSQRTDVALQLEAVYAQLQQAADHIETVEAMKAGAVALKGLNQRVGGAEGVAGVVDALREEMATVDDITNIINESSEPIDEGEIDDEFAELERVEKEKREQEEAAKTAARLAELEQAEQKRKEKEAAEQKKEEEKSKEAQTGSSENETVEQELERASLSFSQMSLQPDSESSSAEKEKEPLPV